MKEYPKDFLTQQNAPLGIKNGSKIERREDNRSDATIYRIDDLGIIRITGADAGPFLQGQMTFDIRQISPTSSSLCAFCNTKGRAFATARIVKTDDEFLLVVPLDLLAPLINKLRMYVLRSDVALDNLSDEFRLFGTSGSIATETAGSMASWLPDAENEVTIEKDLIVVKTGSNNRYLFIAKNQMGERIRSGFEDDSFATGNSGDWNLMEILDGIPTITLNTSEEFVPQMLNLDRLKGISFDKGCYTGQEIVARSHYLGQLKRRTYLAQADTAHPPAPATQLVDCSNPQHQSAGKVVNAALHADGCCYLLAVLKIDSAEHDEIRIENCDGDPITLLELPYSFE